MEKSDLEIGEVDVIQDTFQILLDSVNSEVNCKNRVKPSIYMAPDVLRDLSPISFTPRVVSIGPLHKEDNNVQAFEKQKPIYLISLMNHMESPPEEILKSCVAEVYSSMDRIRACYVWTKYYDDVEVAKMMVMDACFILRFILCYRDKKYNDKLFSGNTMLIDTIKFDLVLLENQIPFFILDKIFKCTILKYKQITSLVEFIHPLLFDLYIFKGNIDIGNISSYKPTTSLESPTTTHILGLLHECYKPQNDIPSKSLNLRINSAVDLDRAGVNFTPNQNPISSWPMGMEVEVKISWFSCLFGSWSKATLRMPILLVGDSTELVFRNLIAYEQSYQTHNHVTSYAYAMDMLVNTSDDVTKLVDSGVLVNYMGSNEEVANMINNIGKEVTCKDFFYKQELEKLYKYCNSYWPKHIARLKSTYFSSPWNIIALVAGIVLFILTVVQTIFTIKPLK